MLIHVPHAVDGSELEHEEDADEDHEDRGAIPDAERDERERNPGHRRDGRQQRDHRVRQLVEDAQRERQATHEHGSHERQRQAAHDAHEAGPDRRESDEVSADSLDADLRQEELRLVLDLGDEDAGGRKDHAVDKIERGGELPECDHGADRQEPPPGALGQQSEPAGHDG